MERVSEMWNDESTQVNGATRVRFESGHEVLERWSEGASQSRRNAVYKALFAVQDGSVFRDYLVVEDQRRADEVWVLLRNGLAVKIRLTCFDSFGIVDIAATADVVELAGE